LACAAGCVGEGHFGKGKNAVGFANSKAVTPFNPQVTQCTSKFTLIKFTESAFLYAKYACFPGVLFTQKFQTTAASVFAIPPLGVHAICSNTIPP
jgi:hypothetical protein